MILRALLALLILAAGFALQELAPRPPASAAPVPPRTLYDGYTTPAAILRAHAVVESGEADWAIGDDGKSRGRLQINEQFHAQRAAKFGPYDPHNCFDALRVADGIWQGNARYFAAIVPRGDPDTWAGRREDLTIAAYRQGVGGVRKDGATYWYVERVRRAMR